MVQPVLFLRHDAFQSLLFRQAEKVRSAPFDIAGNAQILPFRHRLRQNFFSVQQRLIGDALFPDVQYIVCRELYGIALCRQKPPHL